MKPEKVKNKSILEIIEIFENDIGTRKALFKLIDNSPVDDNELARNIFAAATKRRPTNAKLKNVGFKYKDALTNGVEVVSDVKPEAKAKAKVEDKKPEAKVEVEAKKEEVKNPGGEPFKKGSFHLNRLGEVCELLEDYTFNVNESKYKRLIIKMFNWDQMILVDRSIEVFFSQYIEDLKEYIFDSAWTINEYYNGDSESAILESKRDYLELGQRCSCKNFMEEYDLLLCSDTITYKPNVKKGLLPGVDAMDNSTSLKNIKNKISKIKTQKMLLNDFAKELNVPNLKGNFDEIVSQLTEDFVQKNNCDIEGQVRIDGQIYKPSIYSKDTLIKFCKDKNLLLTKDAIMSLSRLKEPKYYKQLVDSSYVIFMPDMYQQNLMLIKLCVELEKYSAAEDSLKLMKDDGVLYRISPKDAGGNFWYVYKCDEAFKNDKNVDVKSSNIPM